MCEQPDDCERLRQINLELVAALNRLLNFEMRGVGVLEAQNQARAALARTQG